MTAAKSKTAPVESSEDFNPFDTDVKDAKVADPAPQLTEPQQGGGEPDVKTPEANQEDSSSKPDAEGAKPEPKPKAPRKPRATKAKDAPKTFADFPHDKLPLNAESGNVQGVIKVHNGLPIAQIGLKFWVGEIPLSVRADELADIENVITALRKEADKVLKS